MKRCPARREAAPARAVLPSRIPSARDPVTHKRRPPAPTCRHVYKDPLLRRCQPHEGTSDPCRGRADGADRGWLRQQQEQQLQCVERRQRHCVERRQLELERLQRGVDEALQCLDRGRRTVHRSGRSGRPRAAALRPVGGCQRQQVARDPRHAGAGRHAADAVDRDDQDTVDHRDARRGRGRTVGKPGGRSGGSLARESRVGGGLRIGDAPGTGRRRQHDLLPGGPRRRRPGPAGRELHRQAPAPEGRADRRRRRGLLAGDHEGDDPDPGKGRDQGQPPDDQRHRHRRDVVQRAVVAGDLAADVK